jgi:hypothetical protein
LASSSASARSASSSTPTCLSSHSLMCSGWQAVRTNPPRSTSYCPSEFHFTLSPS